ncbi:MAG: hypothetical protein WC861_04415 [Candidatus Micrarchaeia archaeon]|jgi:hypothetical protein
MRNCKFACFVFIVLMLQLSANMTDNRTLNSGEGVWEGSWGRLWNGPECNESFYYKYAEVNVSFCESIPDNCPINYGVGNTIFGRRDWCFMTVAEKEGNQSLCAKIVDNGTKYGSVFGTRGGPAYIQGCYGDIAISKNDSALCDNISVETLRERCKAAIALNTATITACGMPVLMLLLIIGIALVR